MNEGDHGDTKGGRDMEVIHPEKSDYFMPFAPGMKVRGGTDLLFVSGCTALPLYHAQRA